MNILYLGFVERNSPKMAGVIKKIDGQMKTFQKSFDKCFYTELDTDGLTIWELKEKKIKRALFGYDKSLISGISRRKSFYNNIIDFIKKNKVDVMYIRYRTSDPFLVRFLKKAKNVGLNIYIEIPTYPYEKEIANRITKKVDKICALQLSKYVKNIITFSNHDEIFGIKTIKINNAVDLDSIPIKINKVSKTNEINLIGVANISLWHGYDRVISGLKEYYDNFNSDGDIINLTIVGEGKELPKLENMVQDYKLGKYVNFKGFKVGQELDEEFNNADIGIVSLGIHRLGLNNVSTLKSKEYWARGIPFVKSYNDKQIDENISEFVLNVEPIDSNVNILDIIKFYAKIKSKGENVSTEMRKMAKDKITWDSQMLPVIEAMIK